MKNLLLLMALSSGAVAWGAQESNPFTIEWSCKETPSCSTDDGNYDSGYAVIGSTYYVDGGSPSSCCRIGKNIWSSACKDGADPIGAKVRCK